MGREVTRTTMIEALRYRFARLRAAEAKSLGPGGFAGIGLPRGKQRQIPSPSAQPSLALVFSSD